MSLLFTKPLQNKGKEYFLGCVYISRTVVQLDEQTTLVKFPSSLKKGWGKSTLALFNIFHVQPSKQILIAPSLPKTNQKEKKKKRSLPENECFHLRQNDHFLIFLVIYITIGSWLVTAYASTGNTDKVFPNSASFYS